MVPFRSHLAGGRFSFPARAEQIEPRRPALVLGLFTLALVGLTSLAAQTRAEPSAPASPNAEIIEAWLKRQAGIRTWSADFVQTRTLKTLTQPLTSPGRIWFAAPDRFRWELGSPPVTIAIRQPSEMWVVYPELKRAERYPAANGKSGQWQSALALLDAGFPTDRASLEARFRIGGIQQSAGRITLALQPKEASARRMIPEIKVVLSSSDFSLIATELAFPDGSTLRNEFSNPQVNPPVGDYLFTPKLTNDYRIVEPLK